MPKKYATADSMKAYRNKRYGGFIPQAFKEFAPLIPGAGYKAYQMGKQLWASRTRGSSKTSSRSSTPSVSGPRMSSVAQQASQGNETKSSFSIVNPRLNLPVTRLLGKNLVNRSLGFSSAATQGVQQCRMIGQMFDAADILNVYTLMGQSTAAYADSKVLLLNCNQRFMITNAESTNCKCTIYDVLAKKDGTTVNLEPQTVFLAGNVDNSGGAAANATIPGTFPSTNPRFRNAYKILKSTPLILTPGQIHVHTTNYDINKIISRERIDALAIIGPTPVSGITIYTMIIFHGTPVHDTTDETLVTIGAAKLDIVMLETLSFNSVTYGHPSVSISTTLATNLTAAQMTDNRDEDLDDTGAL